MTRFVTLPLAAALLFGAGETDAAGLDGAFDNLLPTAYVWRNAVTSDRGVWMPCVWADYSFADWIYVGGWVNQVWDVTLRRSKLGLPQAMNENDFDVHLGGTPWKSADEKWRIDVETGVDWYVYRFDDGFEDNYPTVGEARIRATLGTPWGAPYGEYIQSFMPFGASYFDVGVLWQATLAQLVQREDDFLNRVTFELDGNLSFGDGIYLAALHGLMGAVDSGIGGGTLKLTVGYRVCNHVKVAVLAAYTSVLRSEIRQRLKEDGSDWTFRDLPWGGIQVVFDF